ncbi:hypothetical protein IWZ03DRAFT_221997 [Phyllosticta citriasiana]|uniref:Uncharacterized protein n=2 Tax=Phyllosticta citriasiana TaxID=595635 RepID=A0ABR1KHE6_9PEZI
MRRANLSVSMRLLLSFTPRPSRLQWQTVHPCLCAARHAATESFPRVVQPSLWHNLVPKPFRYGSRPLSSRLSRWERLRLIWRNPATIFIVFGLMMGSNAINLLLLRNSMADYSRKADAKIALLREVFEKVQKGEEVDVEGLLGTGSEESDRDWKEALEEIEGDERSWQSRKRRRAISAESREPQDSSKSSSEGSPSVSPSGNTMSTAAPTASKDAPPSLGYLIPADKRGTIQFL